MSIFSRPWQVVILLSKSGSASNILYFVFSMMWNISESSFNGKFFTGVTSSGASFFTATLFVYIYEFTFTKFFWLNIKSLSNGIAVNIPTVSCFFCKSTYTGFEFHFQSYHLLFSGTFIFLWTVPLFYYPFLQNVLSIYHQETKKKHNYPLCCLCVNWLTDTQWPTTERFWKEWRDWSLIRMHICDWHSDLWTEELAAKFLLYDITHS